MISILIPVYNAEKYVLKALECIAAQKIKDIEVIVVNDGSTDNTKEICENFSKQDTRFKIVSTENKGGSAAKNTALSNAVGDYILFMNSCDIIQPETLEELLDLLLKNNADMSLGNILYVDENLNSIDKYNNKTIFENDCVISRDEYTDKLSGENADFYSQVSLKLFKREVFEGIVFPIDSNYGDIAKIHEIIYNCKKIVVSSKQYFMSIKHSDITEKNEFSPENLAFEKALIDRVNFLIQNNLDKQVKKVSINSLDCSVADFENCVKHGYYYGNTAKKIKEYTAFFKKHCPPFLSVDAINKKVMIVASIINTCPEIYAKYLSIKARSELSGTPEAIKEAVFDTLFKAFSLLPTKKRIIFESHPELMCNTYPVYKYLLEKGLNKDYEFIWLCDNETKYSNADYPDNVKFMTYLKNRKSFGEKIKYMKTIATAKALIYSNQFLGEYGKNKISFWLQHGMPLKASNGTYCIKNKCTAALCEGEFFTDNYSSDARVEKDKMVFFGFPRNDYLNKPNDSLKKFGIDSFDKIIFWLPTYRQRKDTMKNKTVKSFEMENRGTGIPAIETAEDMIRVNEFLKQNNCLIVLKPHPVQDMSAVSENGLSNFFIINDASLKEKNLQLYELLGSCDAMITDYSSVYYDFLLTKKPIGLTIGDIDEYIAKRGFVYKDPLEVLKGEYIYDTDCLIKFIENIKNGNDIAAEERNKVAERIHTITDGKSTQRVGDYIIEQLNKK